MAFRAVDLNYIYTRDLEEQHFITGVWEKL